MIYENRDDLQVHLEIPSHSFKAMLYHVASDEPSNRTNKIDLQKTSNSYESRYGSDWLIEVKNLSFLRCYACVTNMMEYIASEAKNMFEGTNHKSYCLFNHDALL